MLSLLRVLKSPLEERKSGTKEWSVIALIKCGQVQHSPPAEVDIPAPAITTIFRLFLKVLRSKLSGAVWSNSGCCGGDLKSKCTVVRGFASVVFLFLGGHDSSGSRERFLLGCSLLEAQAL